MFAESKVNAESPFKRDAKFHQWLPGSGMMKAKSTKTKIRAHKYMHFNGFFPM